MGMTSEVWDPSISLIFSFHALSTSGDHERGVGLCGRPGGYCAYSRLLKFQSPTEGGTDSCIKLSVCICPTAYRDPSFFERQANPGTRKRD